MRTAISNAAFAGLAIGVACVPALRAVAASAPLHCAPPAIEIAGAWSSAHVTAWCAAGRAGHLAVQPTLTVQDPTIAAIGTDGALHPRRNGRTVCLASWHGESVRIPVRVSGCVPGSPRFVRDVIPVLTHAGCNQGACHGSAQGKGGFKLSLLGYDPESDWITITRALGARRICRPQPDRSLVLLKPTMQTSHRGGLRFARNSNEYGILRAWIACGAPGPGPHDSEVARLTVEPSAATLATGATQRYIVRALYTDGSSRDVTGAALFGGSDDSVMSVSPDGAATVAGPGLAAVVVRYMGQVAISQVFSPFARPVRSPPALARIARSPAVTAADAARHVDALVQIQLNALGLSASTRSSDADFLRRVSLDLTGTQPAPAAVTAFLADASASKRAVLVDSLIGSQDYIQYWTRALGDVCRNSRALVGEKAMYALDFWLRDAVAANRPWNTTVASLLTASGSTYDNGAVNFLRAANSPQEAAEAASQAFLGVRIQCARCHNHPYDRWTQRQYYQMSAFFARTTSKRGDRSGERVVYSADSGEVTMPRTGERLAPCGLASQPLPATFTGDRRDAFAQWLTSPANPWFARETVNRMWAHFFGRGLVEPVDDLRVTNPASNEALLTWLANDFTRNGYDLQRLMRTIVLSATYQRTAIPTAANRADTHYGSHFQFRRLEAETLLDAVTSATGVGEKFAGLPPDMAARDLPDTSVPSYFLDLFGRPARQTTCACERTSQPNLGQVLHLLNSPDISAKLTADNGTVAAACRSGATPEAAVRALYLDALCRPPDPDELRIGVRALGSGKAMRQGAEDLLWALLNTKEFLFNH